MVAVWEQFQATRLDGREGSEQWRRFRSECMQCTSMLVPVSCLCGLVLAVFAWLPFSPSGSWPFVDLLPFHQGCAQGAANAGVIMVAVVVFTWLFTGLFAFRQRRLLLGVLAICYGTPPAALAWVMCVALRVRFGVAVDWFTFALIDWNLLVVLPYVVLQERMSAVGVSNVCILISALGVSWIFLCLDEYTVWFTLVFMVLWDLFAVLSVCGPIHYVLLLQKRWFYMADPFELPRGLSYITEFYALGTGDLVFYAVLFGRACMASFTTGVACWLCVMIGFVLTAVYTIISNNETVPALPFAVVMGTVLYFSSNAVIVPLLEDMGKAAVFM